MHVVRKEIATETEFCIIFFPKEESVLVNMLDG